MSTLSKIIIIPALIVGAASLFRKRQKPKSEPPVVFMPQSLTLEMIEQGVETARLKEIQRWKDIGRMFTEVRDSKLYKAKYGTFENYVVKRWGISQSRAYQFMDAFKSEAPLNPLLGAIVGGVTERAVRRVKKDKGVKA